MPHWIFKIVTAFAICDQVVLSNQAWGASLSEPKVTPIVGAESPAARAPLPASTAAPNAAPVPTPGTTPTAALAPSKVRIGLRLTPFIKVPIKSRTGQPETQFVAADPLRHTLRARLSTVNHFFVSDWHIETKPIKWIKKTNRYEIKLSFYRRYGAFGQLEDYVGAVNLAGRLEEQEGSDQVFVLIGVVRQRLRDKFGSPYLDVVAGFAPEPVKSPFDVSKIDRRPPKGPAEPPQDYDRALIQGRF